MEDAATQTVYCDLDGVIVDWQSGFKRISQGLTGEEYEVKYGKVSSMELIKSHGIEWWANLEWMPDGKDLWNHINDNFVNIKILTATGRPGGYTSMARKGKEIWMKNNLSGFPDKDKIIVGRKMEKAQYAKSGDILIDDTPSNVNDWIQSGGIGVLHKNAMSTISKLKEYV